MPEKVSKDLIDKKKLKLEEMLINLFMKMIDNPPTKRLDNQSIDLIIKYLK